MTSNLSYKLNFSGMSEFVPASPIGVNKFGEALHVTGTIGSGGNGVIETIKQVEVEKIVEKVVTEYKICEVEKEVVKHYVMFRPDGTQHILNKELRHYLFEIVCKIVSTRTHGGAPVPLWLWGNPGAGKTHMMEQVAEALGLKFYPIYLGPTSTESKLLGFKNITTGEYVVGLVVDAYIIGGLLFLDEADVADPSVLVAINALISNKTYRFPDGEIRHRHKDFCVVVGANTLGQGSVSGFKRNAQDAALRDRFVKVKFEIDSELEQALVNSKHYDWLEYVRKVRKYVSTMAKSSVHITPRASINGAALLEAGLPTQVVTDSLLSEFPDDVRRQIIEEVGEFSDVN